MSEISENTSKARSRSRGASRKKSSGLLKKLLIIFLLLILFLMIAGGAYMFHLLGKMEHINNSTLETIDPATAAQETEEAPESQNTDDMPDWAKEYIFGTSGSAASESASEPAPTRPDPAESASSAEESSGEAGSSEEPKSTKEPATSVPTTAFDFGNIQEIDCSGFINLLLVGQDRRPGEGRQRSDAMILVSINPSNGKIAMTSFLRDLYVTVPGYGKTKLNHSYWYGGFPLLYATLEENFCITVDGGFEVDFDGFKAIIDALGGVDITLTSAEAKIVFNDASRSGRQHLDGEHALTYSRIRSIGTDFARTGRQRTVLSALFNKMKGAGVGTLLNTLETILPYMKTDMSNGEIISIAARLAPKLPSMSLSMSSVPASSDYYGAYLDGMSVLVPRIAAIRYHLVHEYLPY